MYDWIEATPRLEQDFAQARLRAMWGGLRDLVQHRSAELIAFDAVRARVLVRGQRDLGVRAVPLTHIVGSEGRARDFDRRFLPRSSRTKDRWKRVALAYYQRRELPAVDLYKIGDVYFVRDGNHRVSAARQRGQTEIDAHVVELETDVQIGPEISAGDLRHIEEQSDFLEWTNLSQVRCCITIEVSELGGYLDLIREINQHRRCLSDARGAEVDRDEAAADWYDRVYLPVVTLVRSRGLLKQPPLRTEADWYLQIVRYAGVLGAQGMHVSLLEAAESYIVRLAARTRTLRAWRHWRPR